MNPSPTDDLELDKLLNKVFSAGIGFARGESMMQAGHLKMTPKAAKAALTAREARKVEETKIKAFDDGYEAGRNETPPSLIGAIDFRREQYGWSDSKMAAMLDLSKAHYSEFKHGKRSLPINSIRKAYAIGIPANVLLQEDIKAQLQHQTTKEGE